MIDKNCRIWDIYCADFGGFVKVGSSRNIKKRICDLERSFKLNCVRYYCFGVELALHVEKTAHKSLKDFYIPVPPYKSETYDLNFYECINICHDAVYECDILYSYDAFGRVASNRVPHLSGKITYSTINNRISK